MLRHYILAIVWALSCAALTQDGSLQQTKMRDLRSYENAGPYTIGLNVGVESRIKLEAKVREFVWEHWHQRRLGYLSITKYSKEGEPSTSHFFVEANDDGVWHVAVTIDRVLIERRGSKRQRHESITYDAYVLERLEVPESGLSQGILIPEREVRIPESYRLALKDEHGKPLSIL